MGFFKKLFGGGKAVAQIVNPTTPAASVAKEVAPIAEAAAEDDNTGFTRDYALEARNDSAGFDFNRDLTSYFVAKRQAEQLWENDSEREALFHKHGVRDRRHWYQVTATFDRYRQSGAARAKWGGPDEILQMELNAHAHQAHHAAQARLQGELKGEMEPVEGVSLEQWARAQAAVVSGGNIVDLLRQLRIDQACWDRVSAEWNARMSRDSTATIAMAYGQAFAAAGQGQFGAAAQAGVAVTGNAGELSEKDAPISLERYCEITAAQSAAANQGSDANAVLRHYGLSAMDWGNVGMWWSQFISKNAMRNGGALHQRYTTLSQKYEAQFASARADRDISF
jgi:hypothetical protein